MARVAYIEEPSGDDRVARGFDMVNTEYGRIGNLFRIIANAPWLLPDVAKLSVTMTAGDEVGQEGCEPGLKRLVQLAVSMQNACAYCTTHNRAWAAKTGVPEAKVKALNADPLDSEHFTEAEFAAISWAKSVAANAARRDMKGFERVQQHFTTAQVVELTVLASYRTMINLMQEAFWTDIEESAVAGEGPQLA